MEDAGYAYYPPLLGMGQQRRRKHADKFRKIESMLWATYHLMWLQYDERELGCAKEKDHTLQRPSIPRILEMNQKRLCSTKEGEMNS